MSLCLLVEIAPADSEDENGVKYLSEGEFNGKVMFTEIIYNTSNK